MSTQPTAAEPPVMTLSRHGRTEVRPRRRRRPPSFWAGLAFIVPLVAYLVLLYAWPLYENVSLSLHRYTRATLVTGKAPFVGFDIYREVLSSPQFLPTLRHTVTFV